MSARGKTQKTYSAATAAPARRAKSSLETFQLLFYATRVKPFVTNEINALKLQGKTVNSSIRLSIQRRLTQEKFDAADATTLSAVEARKASDKSLASANAAAAGGDTEARTPEQYQQYLPFYLVYNHLTLNLQCAQRTRRTCRGFLYRYGHSNRLVVHLHHGWPHAMRRRPDCSC
jgi:hypothetical protein